MRPAAYRGFEIVAWPAAVWGAIETVLRLGLGDGRGAAGALLVGTCAAGTVVLARLRQRQLAWRAPRLTQGRTSG